MTQGEIRLAKIRRAGMDALKKRKSKPEPHRDICRCPVNTLWLYVTENGPIHCFECKKPKW